MNHFLRQKQGFFYTYSQIICVYFMWLTLVLMERSRPVMRIVKNFPQSLFNKKKKNILPFLFKIK